MWGQPASQGGCVGVCGAGRRAWALHFGPPGGWGALGTARWGQPWGRQCVSLCPKAASRVGLVALGGNTELGDLPWGSAPGDPCVTLPGGWGQEVTLLACHCQCPQLMGSTGARLSSPHGDPHFPEPRTHKISPPLSLGGGRVPKHIAQGSAPPPATLRHPRASQLQPPLRLFGASDPDLLPAVTEGFPRGLFGENNPTRGAPTLRLPHGLPGRAPPRDGAATGQRRGGDRSSTAGLRGSPRRPEGSRGSPTPCPSPTPRVGRAAAPHGARGGARRSPAAAVGGGAAPPCARGARRCPRVPAVPVSPRPPPSPCVPP